MIKLDEQKYIKAELNLTRYTQRHMFHLVDPSPWPIVGSCGALFLTFGCAMWMHFYILGEYLMILGFITILLCMYCWWRDVVRESTFLGHHTSVVQRGLRLGMLLFIISEIMFFFAFFWAFFHSSLSPSIQIGCIWPPEGIEIFDPYQIPLLNTLILLLSGCTLTWSHYSLKLGYYDDSFLSLTLTIALGLLFTIFQVYEYVEATFTISDSVYGSTFFIATGFHGLHVMIGTTFLIICLYRLSKGHFTRTHHLGFEFASWYWHFVDVVWIFLYLSIYYWGSGII